MSAAAVKQCFVLSLCLLSSSGHKILCGSFVFVSLLCNSVCVAHVSRQCVVWVCAWMCLSALNVCEWESVCFVCVCVTPLSLLLPKRSGPSWQLTSTHSCLPPVKSNLSLVGLLTELGLPKHRCSASRTDNTGLKDHLRLPAYTIKGLCVGSWFDLPRAVNSPIDFASSYRGFPLCGIMQPLFASWHQRRSRQLALCNIRL